MLVTSSDSMATTSPVITSIAVTDPTNTVSVVKNDSNYDTITSGARHDTCSCVYSSNEVKQQQQSQSRHIEFLNVHRVGIKVHNYYEEIKLLGYVAIVF